jgi:hypothetical protein
MFRARSFAVRGAHATVVLRAAVASLVLAGCFWVTACGSSHNGAVAPGSDAAADVAGGNDAGGAVDTGAPACTVCAGDGATPLIGPPSAAGTVTNTVTIDPSKPATAPVPDDFLGISVEWATVFSYLSDTKGGVEAEVAQLLQSFEGEGHHVVLRVAGNSGDRTFWAHMPAGLVDGRAPVQIADFQLSLLADWHAKLPNSQLIIGLNLVLDDPMDAALVVKNLLAKIPVDAIMAFEIGNEPDLYAKNGDRPSTYDVAMYSQEFDAFHDGLMTALAALNPPLPPTRFSSPDLSNHKWYSSLPAFFTAETSRLSLATVHAYGASTCPGSDSIPVTDLLTDCATVSYASPYPTLVQAAHAAGLKFRVDETNTIAHSGVKGVSNVYASALWGIDAAFELAATGMDGLNFHTPGAKPDDAYAIFDTQCGLGIRPLYYAMRVFSLGTAHQGRLLPVTVTGTPRVKAWATQGSDGAVRVVLVNEDMTGNDAVALQVPGKTGAGSLVRLTAASLDATCGLSLGMQTWDGSLDGKPLGTMTSEPLKNDGMGGFVVALPALQAVVVTAP